MKYPSASEIQEFLSGAHATWVLNGIAKIGNLDYTLHHSIRSSRPQNMDIDHVLKARAAGEEIYTQKFFDQYLPMIEAMQAAARDPDKESEEFKQTFSDLTKVNRYNTDDSRISGASTYNGKPVILITEEDFLKATSNLEKSVDKMPNNKDKLAVLDALHGRLWGTENGFADRARISNKMVEIEPSYTHLAQATRDEMSLQANGGERRFGVLQDFTKRTVEQGIKDMEGLQEHHDNRSVRVADKKDDMKKYEAIRKETKQFVTWLPGYMSNSDLSLGDMPSVNNQIKEWGTDLDNRERVSGSVVATRIAEVKRELLAKNISDSINYSGEDNKNAAIERMEKQSSPDLDKMVKARVHKGISC